MVFLLEALPFNLTFRILFSHGGFDALESTLGRNHCWEFLQLMGESPRADLLCICRAVQLLDHPAHALFLLNYPPDSSIPPNIRAWKVAEQCCIGWSPDVPSVVLAMRAFISTGQHSNHVFPWLDVDDLAWKRSEAEWKAFGLKQAMNYRFTESWWNTQKEAFCLERWAAKSSMGAVIKSTAKAEIDRLANALKRREQITFKEEKGRRAWLRMQQAEIDAKLKENNRGGKRQKKEVKPPPPVVAPPPIKPPVILLTSEDKKKVNEEAKTKHLALQSTLNTVKQALDTIAHNVLEEKLKQVAKLVAAIEIQNPLIKWSLRLLFHIAAEEIGRTVWQMEFLMQKYQWAEIEKPLETLVELAKRKK